MKQSIEIWHTQKRAERTIIWKWSDEKVVSHSKLKLWTFFWGHGECEWPLVYSKDRHSEEI